MQVKFDAAQAMVEDLKPLTSLRFFAAIMIVFFHLPLTFHWPWLVYIPNFMVTGVSFFFVLSGFILTHVYTVRGIPSYSRFLRTRIARLWPSHVFVLLLIVIFIPPNSDTFRGTGIFDMHLTAATNLLMVHSIIPYESYFFSWNAPSWSISTEFFFYLLFPFLVIDIERTWHWKFAGSLAAGLSMMSLAVWLHLPGGDQLWQMSQQGFVYVSPIARIVEFSLGMSAYVLWKRVRHLQLSAAAWTALEIGALILCVLWLTGLMRLVTAISIPALSLWVKSVGGSLAFVGVIIAMADARGVIGRFLSCRVMVYLGSISFAIYLLHVFLLKIFRFFVPELPTILCTLTFAATLLISSALLYGCVERPARAFLTGSRAGKRVLRSEVDVAART